MALGRGGGVNSVRVEGRMNKKTVTAFLQLMLATLVDPAMATPEWLES